MKRIITLIALLVSVVFVVNAQQAIGIKVSTAFGGTLFLDGKEIASLFDNDTYTIPIEKPGTYSVKMKFANGKESTKAVVISARGIVDLGFLMPPTNIILGNVGLDSLPVMWDSAGSGVSYNVYFNKENHLESAKSQNNINSTSFTLTDLDLNNTYYVWVSIVESGIEGQKSAVVSKKLLEAKIDQRGPLGEYIFFDTTSQKLMIAKVGRLGPAGGFIFYDKGNYSDGWRYLEAAPAETETTASWGNYRIVNTNRDSSELKFDIGFGKQNTRIIVNSIGSSGNYAALFCNNLLINGFNDWFLPSVQELRLIYNNLVQKGLGGFRNAIYWSSSSYYSGGDWPQYFNLGTSVNNAAHHREDPGTWSSYDGCRSATFRVRAVRAF